MNQALVDSLRDGLIVSCQAPEGSPLRDPFILGRIAAAAENAGAVAIRAEGLENIRAIKKEVSVPVIGLIKRATQSPIYITPSVRDVSDLVEAGADIIALDATEQLREGGVTASDFLASAISQAGGVPLMADIDTVSSAKKAEKAGATFVGTTLSGYTGGPVPTEPDLELVRKVASAVTIPVIAEGRYHLAQDVNQALRNGALAVCIGTTLTDPWTLTKRMVASLQ